jgi:hypothetical protein
LARNIGLSRRPDPERPRPSPWASSRARPPAAGRATARSRGCTNAPRRAPR